MKLKETTKKIVKRLQKTCSVCGKAIHVVCYSDKSYRGGHYFCDIPVCTKAEEEKASKAGTHDWKFEGKVFQVMNREPKPYKFLEYWECPKCYWP